VPDRADEGLGAKMTEPLILLGRITGAHGIRGAVKLRSFTTDPKAIGTYGALTTSDGRSVEIIRMKAVPDGFIADLKDIKDRNQAESLKGQDLSLPRTRLPAADDNEVYLVDLIGQDAMHNGLRLGSIIGIENFGAGDLLDIDTGAKESLLVPAVFMTMVDGVVTLSLPDGFLDLSKTQE
jgi:16S rRNA processing protein RimM